MQHSQPSSSVLISSNILISSVLSPFEITLHAQLCEVDYTQQLWGSCTNRQVRYISLAYHMHAHGAPPGRLQWILWAKNMALTLRFGVKLDLTLG